MEAKINRRSKIGFGYRTTPTGHGTEIKAVSSPDYTGTPKQVLKKIKNDRAYQAMKNNTYMNKAWFIRTGGQWQKIKTDINQLEFLYDKEKIYDCPPYYQYIINDIDAELI